MTPGLRRKDLFTHARFEIALDRSQKYIDCLKVHGINWIGLILHLPILWSPTKEEEEKCYWSRVSKKMGYYTT